MTSSKAFRSLILLYALALTGLALVGRPAFAGDKYPLTMTATYTDGKLTRSYMNEATYHSGDYDCTPGDANNAPTCHTALEWAQMDSMLGTPNTVLFTMADGSQIGVQSPTTHPVAGYEKCNPGTPFIFCNLYFEILGRTQVSMMRQSKYGATELIPQDEWLAAKDARHRALFGDKDTMTTTFRYNLKGKPDKDGFQRIEIDPASCIPTRAGRYGTNYCKSDITHLLNSRGDGYVKTK